VGNVSSICNNTTGPLLPPPSKSKNTPQTRSCQREVDPQTEDAVDKDKSQKNHNQSFEDLGDGHNGYNFKCQICEHRFKNIDVLHRHIKRVHCKLRCKLCDNLVPDKSELVNHMRNHTGEKPFKCKICDLEYSRPESLKVHVLTHTNPIRFECGFCDRKYRSKQGLECHLLKHTGEVPHSCQQCKRVFTRLSELKQHEKFYHRTPKENIACTICSKKFRAARFLKMHMKCHGENFNFKCHQCTTRFRTKCKLETHVKRVHYKVSCEVCGHLVSDKYELENHMRNHTGEKPFKCNLCDAAYSRQLSLTYHLTTHAKTKRYSCQYCGRKYSCRQGFQSHLRKHNGEAPFPCSQCDKKYSDRSALMVHLKIHQQNPDQLFPCTKCDKKFLSAQKLKSHEQLHGIERNLPCPQCSKMFGRRRHLIAHLKRIHEEPVRLDCPMCDKTFTIKSNLKRHLGSHTQEKIHACTECDKTFQHAYLMIQHREAVHLKLQKHQCPICEQRFGWRSQLLSHTLIVHNGKAIRKYDCTQCGKSLTTALGLDSHMRLHTNEKPFSCKLCSKTFKYPTSLKFHVKKWHSPKN